MHRNAEYQGKFSSYIKTAALQLSHFKLFDTAMVSNQPTFIKNKPAGWYSSYSFNSYLMLAQR